MLVCNILLICHQMNLVRFVITVVCACICVCARARVYDTVKQLSISVTHLLITMLGGIH